MGCVISPCRYYKPGILLMCFILPTIVPWYCWGEAFPQSLFVATFLRYAIVLNATWLVNSAAHLYGYRPYDKTISPRENILVSLGAVGKLAVHSKIPSSGLLVKSIRLGARKTRLTCFMTPLCFSAIKLRCNSRYPLRVGQQVLYKENWAKK